eukprot:scaffold74772_cov53-Attheya_sp.AAC.2
MKSNRSSFTRACNVKPRDQNRSHQRNILGSFTYTSDSRQSDTDGGGLVATRHITIGTVFIDVSSQYVTGKPPPSLLTERGDVIKSGNDYFDLNKGMTQFINEARDGNLPNIRFKKTTLPIKLRGTSSMRLKRMRKFWQNTINQHLSSGVL